MRLDGNVVFEVGINSLRDSMPYKSQVLGSEHRYFSSHPSFGIFRCVILDQLFTSVSLSVK